MTHRGVTNTLVRGDNKTNSKRQQNDFWINVLYHCERFFEVTHVICLFIWWRMSTNVNNLWLLSWCLSIDNSPFFAILPQKVPNASFVLFYHPSSTVFLSSSTSNVWEEIIQRLRHQEFWLLLSLTQWLLAIKSIIIERQSAWFFNLLLIQRVFQIKW